MAWSSETPSYCGWNEMHVTNKRGRKEVHYYLERKDGCADLAAVGRMKSSGRMSFRYASKKNRSILKKLSSRDDLADWLDSIVSGVTPLVADVPAAAMTAQAAGRLNIGNFVNGQFQKPFLQTKEFSWIGPSWTCRKRRIHYSSFSRNGVIVSVNNFVYVLAEQNKRLVAYLEDLYEDSKGNKMVVVRWFHKTDEVGIVLPNDVNDREIFFSHCLQDINIECIDGLATVLSPQHYEKFLKVPMHVRLVAFFCQKLYRDDGIKPYDITQLEGYWTQEMLRYLNVSILKLGEGAQALGTDPGLGSSLVGCVGVRSKRRRSPSAVETLDVSSADDMKNDCKASPDSLELGASDAFMCKGAKDGSSHHIKKGSLVEVLSEDSGIRGCWFRALIIKKHKDKVKVQYQDIQDADDESKKLEEWILASRVAASDHQGLRIPGRKVVRPTPKSDQENDVWGCCVGMSVDVWWCNGWWEGIVVQKVSDEKYEVYLPGEKKMCTFHRSDLRQSLEWAANEWVDIESRFDIVSSVLSLVKEKEVEGKQEDKVSEDGVSNDVISPKGEAKLTVPLLVAKSNKPCAKRPRPVPDLLKDVLVSDLKWKRKRNRIVSCCQHDPSLTDGLSGERSSDCENCKFMGDSLFGSSVGQPLTGLVMSR